ncbi:methylenetetrahydrofolate reductase [NAD(P)H] [Kribbia dieselivorans]|uniref:methylenetetrahydrofolate reductase [NAD(P)H] n=1 Tax=Kribbia dieselivorans TaxID=331526 RepID=UPI000837C6A8|nr:methylenetetrahydrofolate reductase [NAD(P)H] [Kribbia dieselivorans]
MPTPASSIPAALRGDRPSISFEFFPPKDDAGEVALWEAIARLESLKPDFVSVTYGAGGTSQDRTIRVTQRIARETSLTAMAHLTCVSKTVDEIADVIAAYEAAGIEHVLALRGDPPGNPGGEWVSTPGGHEHADSLVAQIRAASDMEIGVAAFPDVHPESADLAHDVDVLVRKHEAGASFAVTQMIFDTVGYLRLRDEVSKCVDMPITPGIMPVTNVKQIARMTQLMGTPLPPKLIERLEAVDGDPAAVRAVGVEWATNLARDLLAEGAPGIHFNTMNRSTATLEVYGELGLSV